MVSTPLYITCMLLYSTFLLLGEGYGFMHSSAGTQECSGGLGMNLALFGQDSPVPTQQSQANASGQYCSGNIIWYTVHYIYNQQVNNIIMSCDTFLIAHVHLVYCSYASTFSLILAIFHL